MILRRLLCFIVALSFLVVFTESLGQAISVFQVDERLISESAILIDGDTGQILYEKNMHELMRPASITKMMTVLLALELGDLEDTVTMTSSAWRGIDPTAARISLIADEEITLEDAIYATAVVSAADTSNAIAEHISGSVSDFVALMNQRAKELGALNTNFTNAHGMPDDRHLTTAYDMALIAMAAVNTPGFNEIFSARRYNIPPTNVQRTTRRLRNQNQMISGDFRYTGFLSGKTGWTIASQHTLFTAAERDGRTLICISLRTPNVDDKYKDTIMLFNYGFNEFESVTFPAAELENFSLLDDSGRETVESFTVDEDFTCLIPKVFSKEQVIIEYIIESTEDDEDNEDGDDGNNSEGDAIENPAEEVDVRIVLTLRTSALWTGVKDLGEITATARIIEHIEEEDIPEEEPPEPEPSPEPTPAPAPEPVPDNHENEDARIEEDPPPEPAPVWVQVLKDAGVFIVLFVIVLCFIINKKRRDKRTK